MNDRKKKLESETYSIEEACVILGIGRASGYKAAQTGELPTITIGRLRRVPRAKLQAMLTGAT